MKSNIEQNLENSSINPISEVTFFDKLTQVISDSTNKYIAAGYIKMILEYHYNAQKNSNSPFSFTSMEGLSPFSKVYLEEIDNGNNNVALLLVLLIKYDFAFHRLIMIINSSSPEDLHPFLKNNGILKVLKSVLDLERNLENFHDLLLTDAFVFGCAE